MRRWRWPVAVVVVILVLGTGGYAVAQTRETDPSYSTAVATIADVERTLDLSGTVTAAGRRDLTFGASGTVSKVAVRPGQRVRSGQVLARLDPTSFDAAVTSAVATLARAKAQLAADQDAQAEAVSDSADAGADRPDSPSPDAQNPKGQNPKGQSPKGQSPKGQSPNGQTPSTGTDPALQQLLAKLAGEQKAVTEAQSAASAALATADTALAEQADACRSEADPEPSSSSSPSGTDAETDADSSVSAECTEALAAVQAAQDTVAKKQQTLQSALSALGETLGQAVTVVGKPSQDQPSAQNQNPSSNQAQGAPAASEDSSAPTSEEDTPQGASSGESVTAARLAQDQADIDTAQARLTQARAERGAATLRAPYDGRILQSDVAKGDLVSATDPAFVLVGSGATTVTTTLSTAQVPSVRRGQKATVVPAGWSTSLTGSVSAIGLLPDSDGVFPVTVTVSSTRAVAEGTTASVSIVTGSVADAVTVPVSALKRGGDRATVQVLSGGTVGPTSVTVGVVGSRRASITKGLKEGTTVVLADLEASVPSANANQGDRLEGPVVVGPGGGPGTVEFKRPPG